MAVEQESVMMARFLSLLAGEEGQDLVEYALLAALISISSVAALSLLRFSIFISFLKLISNLR